MLSDYSRWHELDIAGIEPRHSKSIRYPEILACAKELRAAYGRLGTIGFCFGGWAVFRLGHETVGARTDDGDTTQYLVDCITAVHPTWLTKEEIANVRVPTQILSPVHDVNFTSELKNFAHQTIPTLNVPYDYQLFPGVEHGFAIRGNRADENEIKGMQRAKDAAVNWFRIWLRVWEE